MDEKILKNEIILVMEITRSKVNGISLWSLIIVVVGCVTELILGLSTISACLRFYQNREKKLFVF